MAWTQYSTGLPYPIMTNTSQDLSYVKGRTVLETRRFINDCNGTIRLDNNYAQHPARINDVSIMNLVNTQTIHKVNLNQKEKINCV